MYLDHTFGLISLNFLAKVGTYTKLSLRE